MTAFILALVMLINFLLLGSGRIRVLIQTAALQGVVISTLPLVAGHGHGLRVIGLTLAALVVKGFVIPALLIRACNRLKVRREIEPAIGYVTSLLLCAIGTGFALVVGNSLPVAPGQASGLAVPASLATVFTGFLLLITRRKAITQATGYLVLENGITVFGLLMVGEVPFLVETSVLLDLVAGVFVMVMVMNHLQREFTTLDTRQLTTLRE